MLTLLHSTAVNLSRPYHLLHAVAKVACLHQCVHDIAENNNGSENDATVDMLPCIELSTIWSQLLFIIEIECVSLGGAAAGV